MLLISTLYRFCRTRTVRAFLSLFSLVYYELRELRSPDPSLGRGALCRHSIDLAFRISYAY